MTNRTRRAQLLLAALLALLVSAPIVAQERSSERGEQRTERPTPSGGVLRLLPGDAVSDKQIIAGGRTIRYTATAGTLSLYDQNGERSAAIFYTAYTEKNADAARRPVTFVFNGGPGAASAYLHIGLVGPRIIDFGPDGRDGAAAKLRDNPDSWLAFTDLVLIDPVGAGWSRPVKPDGGNAFWGVQRDAEVLAKVVMLWLGKNSRFASPKFLLGESYGGFRAAKVARALTSDQGIVVSGIMMVSPLIESSMLWGGSRFALGAALHFPSLVATELERTKRYTPEAMAEAERFAVTDYLTALAGPPLPPEKAKAFYERVAQMTGLSVDTVAKARGHVRELYLNMLRANGETVSVYDATFAVPDPFPESQGRRGSDPVLDGFTRALSGTFVAYARDELGFKTEMTYNLLNGEVGSHWDWGNRRDPPGISDDIRTLLSQTPSFRLLVAHGRSDLVTPYGVSRYLLDAIPPIGAANRVQLKLHRGGHMFYFDEDVRRAFTAEAREFFRPGP